MIRNATTANNGTYTLVATDANGCTSTAAVDVTTVTDAQSKPQITSSGPACADGTVALSVAGYAGSSVSYAWEYDSNGFTTAGGSTTLANASGQNTARLVLTPISATGNAGEYRVRVTVDGCVLQSDAVAVVVFPQPAATAVHTTVTACDPGDVQLSATAVSNVASYAWTGPNGFTSDVANPRVFPATAAANGTYRLTVTSVSGCTSASTTTVTGVLPPAATPELFVDEVCAGGSLTFSTPSLGTTFAWIGPDGLVKATTTNATAAASSLTVASTSPDYLPGAWRVRVTNADGCVATSPAKTAVIKPVPLATASGNVPVCLGTEAVFSVDALAGATYNWFQTSSSTVSLSQNRTLAVNGLAVGTQTRYVEVSVNGCTSARTAAAVVVNAQPSSAPTATYVTAADCSPRDLQLAANASAGTAPYTYAWTGPNGFTSTQANPLIANAKPANNGSYALVVTDANGCGVATTSVQVNAITNGVAQPAITASGPVCAGARAVLSTQAYAGSSVTYTWTFADGTNPATTGIAGATGQGSRQLTLDPATAANHAGSYTVTVNVDGCVLTSPAYTLVVNAKPAPAPSFTYAATGNCSADDLTLSTNGTAPAGSAYAWTGPNGFASAQVNPVLTAATTAANGTYQVTVTSPAGCSTTGAVTVSGVRSGITRPTVASSGPACVGGVVQLSVPAYSGSNVTYAWTIPAAATTAGNVTGQSSNVLTIRPLVAAHAGSYSVTVTVDGCASTSAAVAINVFAAPTLAPSATNGVICAGGNLQLNAGGSGATSWSWSGPAGFASSAQNPLISGATPARNGTYVVTATNVSGCATTASVAVNNVRDQPTTPVVNANGPVCETGTIQLSSATAYTGTVTYRWTNGNGVAIPVANGGQTAIASFPADATFAVSPYRLQVTVDACAAPISAALPVQVDRVPVATASNTGPVCAGQSVTLIGGEIAGGRYEWRTGGTLVSTDRSFTVSAIAATADYALTVVRGECTSAAVTTTVTVNPAPNAVPDFAYTAAGSCALADLTLRANPTETATATAGYTYRWTGPNDFTSTERNPVIRNARPVANGSYTVVISDGSSAACAKTFTVEVSGVVAPVNKPVVTAGGEGCEGGVVTLSVPVYPGANVSYTWSTPAGTTADISGANTNVLRIATSRAAVHAGDYGVTVIVEGCPATSDAYGLRVTPRPTAAPTQSYTLAADCSVSGVDFAANATGTAPLNYAWSGPNGFTSNSATPRIDRATVASNGSYTVTVTDANGCTASGSVQVSGVREPVAKPQIASTGDACAGGNVVLSVAAYAGSNVTYAWTIPAAAAAEPAATRGITGANTRQLVITPASAALHGGTYAITVTVDGCTVASEAFAVSVYPLPTAAPNATAGVICPGGDLLLQANATDAVSYEWTGPNGFTSTAQDPILSGVTAAANGTYVLRVTSVEGCTSTASVAVSNVRPALAQPSVSSNGPVCEGSTIALRTDGTELAGRTYTYRWTDANGATLGTTRNLSVATTSAQPFRLALTEDGCAAPVSAALNVTVDRVPTATASNSGPVCFGESSTLTAGFVTDASYAWSVQGSSTVISTDRTLAVTPAATTTYELVVTRGTCASAVASTTVRINAQPTAAPDFAYTLAGDCSARDLQLTANAGGGTPTAPATTVAYRYAWTGPNGFASTEADPLIRNATPAANGSYRLTVADENGCSATATREVSGIQAAPAKPQIASSGPACQNGTVTLSVAGYSGSNVSYAWTLPAGLTAAASANVSGQGTNRLVITPVAANHAGDYRVEVIVDGCTLTSDAVAVQVFAQPSAAPTVSVTDACANGSFRLAANATGASAYVWTGPNGYTSTLPNPTVSPATVRDNGSYFVTVTSVSGCTATASVDVTQVRPAPATPTIIAPGICRGEDLALSTDAAGAKFEWIGPNGDAPATLAQPGMTTTTGATTLAPANANYLGGEWRVRVTDAAGCVATSPAAVVRISDVPVATPRNDGSHCFGAATVFTVDAVQGATYAWYDANPATPGAKLVSQERSFARANLAVGSHTFYAVVSANGCASAAVSTTATVTGAPSAAPTFGYALAGDCSTRDLNLAANASGGSGSYNYVWTGPNGFTSTLADPTISGVDASANGSYSLRVVDVAGCEVRTTLQVSGIRDAVSKPVITASGPTCAGGTVRLEVPVYTGSNVTYAWTTPAGVTAGITGANTAVLVISPARAGVHEGDYTVRITVDGCTLDGDPYAVALLPQPTAAPTATAGRICAGGNLQLTANATGASRYAWTGPNGFASSAENPLLAGVTPVANGTYALMVTNSNGCSTTANLAVTGVAAEPVRPTVQTNTPVCETGTLTARVVEEYYGTVVYRWTNAAGAVVGGDTPGLILAANDPVAVPPFRVQVTEDGCAAPLSAPVNVQIDRVPVASASNGGPVCFGESLTLTAGNVDGGRYTWRRAGSPDVVSTDRVFTVSQLSATTTYQLTVQRGECTSAVASTTAVVNQPNAIAAQADYTLRPDCSASDLALNYSVTTTGFGDIASQRWTGPNGFTSTLAAPTIPAATAAANGTYRVVATDVNGCTAEASVQVTNAANPQPVPQVTSSGPACVGGAVTLSAPSYTGSNVTYVWTLPASATRGVSGQGTPRLVLTPVEAGVHEGGYGLTVTVDGCTLSSKTVQVDVFAQPTASPSFVIANACDGGSFALSANATDAVRYAWTGPNGFTSALANPVIHQATAAANGTYELTVTSVNGCTAAASVTVSGMLAPAEVPTISGPSVCAGEDLVLSTGTAGVKFEWIGPRGAAPATLAGAGLTTTTGTTTLTASNADYLSGNWSVRVTDANGCVATSPAIAVQIKPVPVAKASNDGPHCVGTTTIFTVNAVAGATYVWYDADPAAGGKVVGREQQLARTGLTAGTHTYWVTITSSDCTSAAASTTVTIDPTPTAAPSFAYVAPANCGVADLSLAANADAATVAGTATYRWRGPNGFTSTLADPVIANATPAANGSYEVTVTSAAGCSATRSVYVGTVRGAIAQPQITSTPQLCAGGRVVLEVGAYAGTSVEYRWTTPAGVTAGINGLGTRRLTIDPAQAAVHSGDYQVEVTVDGCRSTSYPYTLTVFEAVTAAPEYSYALAPDCSPRDLRLSAKPAGGDATYRYSWTGPDGFTSTLADPVIASVTPAANGSYVVTVTDGKGCSATATVEVRDIAAARAKPVIASSGPACEGGTIVLEIPAYAGSNVVYTWTTPAGTTSAITGLGTNRLTLTPVAAGTHAGDYAVQVTVDGCVLDSAPFAVKVFTQPTATPVVLTPSICTGETLRLEAGATDATTYAWSGPNGFTSASATPVIANATTAANGTYTVTASNASGCATTATVTVDAVRAALVRPSITSNGPVCRDAQIELTIAETYVGSAVTYRWLNATGAVIGTSRSISLAANSADARSPYRVEVSVDGCTSAQSVPTAVQVDEVPTAIANNSGPVCVGTSAQLFGGELADGRYEWRIQGTTAIISTDRVTSVRPGATTSYELTVRRGTCTSATVATTTVVVNTPDELVATAAYTLNPDCSASDIAFDVTSAKAAPTAIASYAWTGPNGFRSTLRNPVLTGATPAANGTYSVIATDVNGCQSSASVDVRGIQQRVTKPVVAATGPTCAGGRVTLSIPAYTGSNVSYVWTFPSATRVSGQGTPTLVIDGVDPSLHDGNYAVTVTADGCTVVSEPYVLTSLPAPTAAPTATVTDACAGGSVAFAANASGVQPLRYAWTGPNGFASADERPVLAKADQSYNGRYTLEVMSANGCAERFSVTVTGLLPPAEKPTIVAPSVCQGEPLRFSTSAGGVKYEWIGPNGASAGTLAKAGMTTTTGTTGLPQGHPSYLPGNWSVRVTDASGCTATSAAVVVTITPVPVATPNNDGPHCVGTTTLFSADAVAGATYAWYASDPSLGATIVVSQERVFSRVNLPVGTHTFYVVVTNNKCASAPVATTARIDPAPTAAPSFAYVAPANCGVADLSLAANADAATAAGAATYRWRGPNGFRSTLANPVIANATPAANGSYEVTVTSAAGCVVTRTVNVTTVRSSLTQPEITSTAQACTGARVILEVAAYTGASVEYRWMTPGNTTAGINGFGTRRLTIDPAVASVHSGDYQVEVTVDGCRSTSYPYTLTVFEAVTAAPEYSYALAPDCSPRDLRLSAKPAGGDATYRYSWTGPDGFTSTLADPVIASVTPAANGSYVVTVTDGKGCSATATVEVRDIAAARAKPVIASSGPACEGGTIVLDIPAYAGSSVVYTWTTPGGVKAGIAGLNSNRIQISPAQAAAHSGAYRVSVNADGCVVTSEAYEVVVYDQPVVAPSVVTTAICTGDDLRLAANATGSGTLSYEWTGPNGFRSAAPDPVVANATLAANGTYTVTVRNTSGCTTTERLIVSAVMPVPAQPIASSNAPVCVDGSIGLTVSNDYVGTSITYRWTNGSGQLVGSTRAVTLAAGDPLVVQPFRVAVTVDGCAAPVSAPLAVQVDAVPVATANNSGETCVGGLATLTAGTVEGSSYQWRVAGNPAVISTERSFAVRPTATTSYELMVVRGECTSAVATTTVIVNVATPVTASANYTLKPDCSTSDIAFDVQPRATGGSYAWAGPNGFRSTLASPVITAATPAANGTYAVTVVDANGCSTQASVDVSGINGARAQPVIAASGPACDGERITLEVPAYTGSSVRYSWTTPAGNTAGITGLNSNRIVISPVSATLHNGEYRLTVTVDGCTLQSEAYEVRVFAQPTAAPTANAARACDDGRLELSANATNAVRYAWTGPNDFTSAVANPVVEPASQRANGEYTLTVTSVSGCVATATVQVSGLLAPAELPTLDAARICRGEDLVLRTSAQGIKFEWIGPHGASVATLAKPGMTTTVGTTRLAPDNENYLIGEWRVRVTDANGCVATSPAKTVAIEDVPVALAANDGPHCAGVPTVFSASADVAGVTYRWYDAPPASGGGLVAQTASFTLRGLAAGSHTYYVTAARNGCTSAVVSTTVVIEPAPSVAPTYSYSVAPDCAERDLLLRANPDAASVAGGATYRWRGPGGFTSTLENPVLVTVNAAQNGSYEVTVTNRAGCVATATVQVDDIVNAVAQPIITSTGPTCLGGEVVLSVPAYSGTNVSYVWTVPSGVRVTGQRSNVIRIQGADAGLHDGDYRVEVRVNDCVLTSAVYTLTSLPAPTAAPRFTVTVPCDGGGLALFSEATGVRPLSYAWTGPNGFRSADAAPVLTQVDQRANGRYTLVVTSANGCQTTETLDVTGLLAPAEVPTLDAPSICRGDELVLRTSASGVKFEWIGPNGASAKTLAGPGMTTTAGATSLAPGNANYLPGEWRVRVTDVNGCVATSPAVRIAIDAVPQVTVSNDGPHCAGAAAELSATTQTTPAAGAAPIIFTWYDRDPSVGTVTPVAFGATYRPGVLPKGVHTYYVTAGNGSCVSAPVATSVTIEAQPLITDLRGAGSYCQNDSLTLGATVRSEGAALEGASYTWRGPAGFAYSGVTGADGMANATLEVGANAGGTYTLEIVSRGGCVTPPKSVIVKVVPKPATPALSASEAVVCEGNNFTLSTAPYSGNKAVEYTWTFEGDGGARVLATTAQPTYIVRGAQAASTGVYSVQVVLDGCASFASNGVLVTVFGALSPVVTSNATTAEAPACEGDLVRLETPLIPGATYEWFGPGNFRSSLPSPVVGPVRLVDAGEYQVTVTVNGCRAVVGQPTRVYVQAMPKAPTIVATEAVCEGGSVTLSVSSPLAPSAARRGFEWYRASDNKLLATTEEPSYTMEGLTRVATGDYYVVMALGSCRTPASAPVRVQVDHTPTNQADAGANASYCAVQAIKLNAVTPTVGTGRWTSITGATVSNPDARDADVIDLREGRNLFVWSLSNGACRDYDADTVAVTITTVPVDVAYAGEDVTTCGPENARIAALRPTKARGVWTQSLAQASRGARIAKPDSAETALLGLIVGQRYQFVWVLTDGVCEAYARDTVNVTISESPDESAFVIEEVRYVCGVDNQRLDAVTPLLGTGRWTTTGGARIASPRDPASLVERLDAGVNVFVWTLSNGACAEYSTDTMRLVVEPKPTVGDDAFATPFNTALEDVMLMDNDVIRLTDYVVTFDTAALRGRIEGNMEAGMRFVPDENYVGVTSFTYTVCDVHCPTRCATARVAITVAGANGLTAPTIFTPNGDGDNDAFVVPGIIDYPGSTLSVYNRWGDEVYHSEDYRNDWGGTYRAEDLPVGTYFYLLRINNPQGQTEQGYLYIQR